MNVLGWLCFVEAKLRKARGRRQSWFLHMQNTFGGPSGAPSARQDNIVIVVHEHEQ